MRKRRSAISVLVYVARPERSHWQFLLLRRTKRAGGFWQGVTGAIEDGNPPETPAEAAARELCEETGLTPLEGVSPIDYVCEFETSASEWWGEPEGSPQTLCITEHTFLAIAEAHDEPTLSEEHDAYRWCGLNEALALLKYENNREALRKCAVALGLQTG